MVYQNTTSNTGRAEADMVKALLEGNKDFPVNGLPLKMDPKVRSAYMRQNVHEPFNGTPLIVPIVRVMKKGYWRTMDENTIIGFWVFGSGFQLCYGYIDGRAVSIQQAERHYQFLSAATLHLQTNERADPHWVKKTIELFVTKPAAQKKAAEDRKELARYRKEKEEAYQEVLAAHLAKQAQQVQQAAAVKKGVWFPAVLESLLEAKPKTQKPSSHVGSHIKAMAQMGPRRCVEEPSIFDQVVSWFQSAPTPFAQEA